MFWYTIRVQGHVLVIQLTFYWKQNQQHPFSRSGQKQKMMLHWIIKIVCVHCSPESWRHVRIFRMSDICRTSLSHPIVSSAIWTSPPETKSDAHKIQVHQVHHRHFIYDKRLLHFIQWNCNNLQLWSRPQQATCTWKYLIGPCHK